ncbi:agamous-like MADS-box protein AGL80 [Phalaenopsis equestris]|uniref:agamous-like MADS-box protein AGL80 n=1 Tax=Phalaenopsis equestris TaxID=78828 RepID=UPI0009E4EFA4|nr:agamous-like MADS-box protein AGL80 [Phalaenopsis equestris]
MARKKVKLEWIANGSARRATFKKRRKGVLKKVEELSTLCDVKACLIVYGPGESQPEVWPSPQEANRVLAKLRRLPEMEQSRKMMNQEGFIRHRITKLQEQIRKQDRENRELETMLLMQQGLAGKINLQSIESRSLTSLAWLIELKMKEVRKRLELLPLERAAKRVEVKQEEEEEELPPMAEISKEDEQGTAATPEGKERKVFDREAMEDLQRQEWFCEFMNPQDEIMDNDSLYFEHAGPAWLDDDFPKN